MSARILVTLGCIDTLGLESLAIAFRVSKPYITQTNVFPLAQILALRVLFITGIHCHRTCTNLFFTVETGEADGTVARKVALGALNASAAIHARCRSTLVHVFVTGTHIPERAAKRNFVSLVVGASCGNCAQLFHGVRDRLVAAHTVCISTLAGAAERSYGDRAILRRLRAHCLVATWFVVRTFVSITLTLLTVIALGTIARVSIRRILGRGSTLVSASSTVETRANFAPACIHVACSACRHFA
jgi:hypothetical protein